MGGGLISNVLLGNPQSIFFSPTTIPIYAASAIIFWSSSTVYSLLDSLPTRVRSTYFHVIDALSRGYALVRFLSSLRLLQLSNGSGCSLVGQVILGTIYLTGGGLSYGKLKKHL